MLKQRTRGIFPKGPEPETVTSTLRTEAVQAVSEVHSQVAADGASQPDPQNQPVATEVPVQWGQAGPPGSDDLRSKPESLMVWLWMRFINSSGPQFLPL